jgi:hypothetical protein
MGHQLVIVGLRIRSQFSSYGEKFSDIDKLIGNCLNAKELGIRYFIVQDMTFFPKLDP